MGNIFVVLTPLVHGLVKLAAGLTPQTIEIEPGTTMNVWVPKEIVTKKDGNIVYIPPTKPAVVLLHSFAMDGIFTWFLQVLALGREYSVYVPDFLFFGGSITNRNERSASFQAEFVAKGLGKLQVEKSFVASDTVIELTESISIDAYQRLGLSSWRRRYIYREREKAEERLIDDYFGDDEYEPKYPEETFRRRYRMSSTLFNKIVNDILSYDVQPIPEYFTYFSSRLDATGRKSIGPILKCTSAIRQLAYGTAPDAFDEYLQIAERTSRECLDNFTKCIHVLYNHKFLRRPSATDIEKTYKLHEEKHGLPGMLGSIDCMHWDWKNCPKSLHGQFKRRDHKYPTLMLEAVADQRLWIWHAYFGVPGANNDLNVLYGSPLFDDEIADIAPECPFIVNGHTYRKCYYLADGIYPEWSTFVKTFSVTRDAKTFKFKTVQEAARKDIERAFGVLQGGRNGPQVLEEPMSDEILREMCDKNYHQLLPLIAEKMQKEKEQKDKLNAVKARLIYGEEQLQ
ncbi:ALP1-like protein [Tanacetum coccineum]